MPSPLPPVPPPSYLDRALTTSCMVRVRGRDPHRRKLHHHSFYHSLDGFLTLQCSGLLLYIETSDADHPHVHVLCHADILSPFLLSSSPPDLLDDTSVTCLPSLPSSATHPPPPSPWWECEVVRCGEVEGVQAAVDQLTHSSSDWAVGWGPCTPPASFPSPPPPCRLHSAGALALLKVVRPLHSTAAVGAGHAVTRALPTGFPTFPPYQFLPSAGLHRGLDVSVLASPFGLLSPSVFQGSVSRGVLSNVVHPIDAGDGTAKRAGQEAIDYAGVEAGEEGSGEGPGVSFPSASVSFPRQLHFPLQSAAAAFVAAAHCAAPSASCAPSPTSPLDSTAALLLTDARCLAGAEGAPVILSSASAGDGVRKGLPLVGLVTLPLHQTNASPVQLNSVITAESLWRWLLRHPQSIPDPRYHSLSSLPPRISLPQAQLTPSPCSLCTRSAAPLEAAEATLLIARIGSSWASAIIVSADGLVVTNAHLVRPHLVGEGAGAMLSAEVTVSLSALPLRGAQRQWWKARLLWCDSLWDLALLQVNGMRGVGKVKRQTGRVEMGERVFVLGHALFSPSSMLLPTLTRGVLCKRVWLRGGGRRAVLLQTDAAVHNGNSGGLLLSAAGEFIGLVTSNVMHTAKPMSPGEQGGQRGGGGSVQGVIIPHLNFSIPAEVVWGMVEWVQGGIVAGKGGWEGDVRAEVEAVWALSAMEVWEVKERERSAKFKVMLQTIRQMEEEKEKEVVVGKEEQLVAHLTSAAAQHRRARL